MKTYKLRVHKARVETRFGVTVATLYDDPVQPRYNYDTAVFELMKLLDYTPNEDSGSDYTGHTDDDEGAYFDYDGYHDIEIPASIVERIVEENSR